MNTSKKRGYLIGRSFYNSLFAALLSTMITNISTVTDGMITGNFIGAKALSAIGLATPVLMVIDCLYDLLFDGAAARASVDLGNGDKQRLRGRLSMAYLTAYIFSSIGILTAVILLPQLTGYMIKNDPVVQSYLMQYLRILLLFRLLNNLFLPFTRYYRAIGMPKATTLVLAVASIGNLVFDLVFVMVLGGGVAGSAVGTVCGWLVSYPLIFYYYRKAEILKLINPLPWIKVFIKENILCGLPGVLGNLLVSMLSLTVNTVVQTLYGINGVTVITICMQILTFSGVMVFGLRKTMQLIGGIFLGEKDYQGIRIVYHKSLVLYAISVGIMTIFLLLFPGAIAGLYGCHDPQITELACMGLRQFSLILLPLYFLYIQSTLFQLEGHFKLSIFSSAFPLVLLIVLLRLSDDVGSWLFWWSFVIVGIVSLLLVFWMSFLIYSKEKGLFFPSLLIKESDFTALTLNVSYSQKEIAIVLDAVMNFCQDNELEKKCCDRIQLFVEEMTQNIISYAKRTESRKKGYLEIRICKSDLITISFKDDGVPFNPIMTKEELAKKDYEETPGRRIISAGWNEVVYDYVCGQNMTKCRIPI